MPASTVLQHPERIHPALWRASQIAPSRRAIVPTGHQALDRALPGGGWPLGTLIEFLPERPGIGELQLLQPALAELDPRRLILLVDPPHPPSMQCWANWGLQSRRLAWLRAGNAPDRLWAAEQAIRHDACTALMCWTDQATDQALLRLQRLARTGNLLLILLRPHIAIRQPSPAVLRVRLSPARQGLNLDILKRRGSGQPGALAIRLYSDALDLSAPASTRAHRPIRAGGSSAALYAASGRAG